MLIRINRSGGVVTIAINVATIADWRYLYRSDEYKFVRTDADPGPYVHTLGMPHELDRNIDTWDVQMINRGDKECDYSVELTWNQDGQELGKWTAPTGPTRTIGAGKIVVESGNAYLVVV